MSNSLIELSKKLSENLGLEHASDLISTLKSTAFRTTEKISDDQLVALLIVANNYGLNPWTKEIYAFPDKGGIVPVVGLDGWSRIINEHPRFDGLEFNYSENQVVPDRSKSCPEWVECIIYRNDRSRPIKVREHLDETFRPAIKRNSEKGTYFIDGPWQSHTKRMLRHKALIQCARLAFGFAGIYDEDEAGRIVESKQIFETPKNEIENKDLKIALINKAEDYAKLGTASLKSFWESLNNEEKLILGNEEKKRLYDLSKNILTINAETGEVLTEKQGD